MGLSKSLRWSLLWICLLAGCISVLGQGGNVRRVYRRNGNYGRRIIPQISSVLQTPSRRFRVHEPLLETAETRRVGNVIHRPSNRLVLPTIERQDQDAEETDSAGYSYAAPEATTAHPGYAYKRPAPIAEQNDEAEDEHEGLVDESPAHVSAEREAEFPQISQEAAFGLISEQEVAAEEIQPESAPSPVVDSPIAEISDSDAQCNENDHDCWPHGYKGVIRGEAGTDYPILTEIIPTAFDCNNVQYSGYYADTDEQARCQIFHICLKRNKYRSTQKWSFLCPNGTVFDQSNFVCVWWDMAPDCNAQTVEPLYSLNEALGWDNITETEFDVNSVMSAMGDSQKNRHFQDSGLSLHQSSTRLKNTIVELPTTKRPPPSRTSRPRTRTTPPQQQLQTQSRNSAYRIPIRVSDGARDRTALKSVTNNIGDYSDAEHETDESSTYETSLRTEHQTETRYKTKSGSALLQSQSEAYEEKSNPQSIRPFIANNRKPYVDRDETTTISARDNKVPTVVMMQAQHRHPDGSEGVVNVPVIIMKQFSQQNAYDLQENGEASSNIETPQSGYLPPSKTTEEYDPVEQPAFSTQPSRYLPPVTEVIPPTTEDTQYQQELEQQSLGVVTEDANAPVEEVDTTTDIDVGYRYPKPSRQAMNSPFFESLRETTTRPESGYRYPTPTTTLEPQYAPQEEAEAEEAEGYRYPKPTTKEPEYNQHQEQEISTQENLVATTQEEFSTAATTEAQTQSNIYLPPKEEQQATEKPQSNTYLPPKEDQTTLRPQPSTYLPPKVEEATQNSQPNAYLPPKTEQTTVNPQPNAYLPPKVESTTEQNAEIATELPSVATTQQEAATESPNAYLPPKQPEGYSYPNSSNGQPKQKPATGRAITKIVSSAATIVSAPTEITLPGVDTKEKEESSEEQSSEESNEVVTESPKDEEEKFHFPTPATPVVTADSEDLGTPSQLYNANVRQQFYAKNKSKPQSYEENAESQEKINAIIRQLQAGVAEAEDSNGNKIDFAEFAKLNAKIALVVPQPGSNGTEQTSQTLIFDTSTESITEALKNAVPSSAPSPSSIPLSLPSVETLPVEDYIQNPFSSSFASINTPQYEITLPKKEFESHSVENSIDHDRNPNPQQFSALFNNVNNNFPQRSQNQQPQISNYIQPQVSVHSQTIQNPPALYNQPQTTQNYILPVASPTPQQFRPQELFFQPQSHQQQEPVYSPPPLPVNNNQQNFVPSQQQNFGQSQQQNFVPSQQQNFVQPQTQNFVQSQPQTQNFVQSQPQQQNFVQSQPQQQNFVQSQPQQQNFVQPQQQNFIHSQPQQQNVIQEQPRQPNYIQEQPRQQNFIQEPQQQNFIQEQRQQPEVIQEQPQQNFIQQQPQRQNYRPSPQQQTEIFSVPPQQNFVQSQPQETNFNQQRQPQQSLSDNRYLPPGRPNYSRQNRFNNQQQSSFQQPQSQATFNQPQIVDFSPAKPGSLESLTTKKSKLISPADIKIVPAIFVHHHTSVENPDGSPVQGTTKPSQETPQRQQQSFQNAGFYEPPAQRRNVNNQFRNSNFLPFSAQTENVAVTVNPPTNHGRSLSQSSSAQPPSPSKVFTPQLEKFTLDDARTADQLQIYHKQNLRTFRPLQPTNPSVESSTVYIGAGSGRLDMSPEQSSLADTSRFYPGRDNSLGVKLTYN